MATTTKRKRPGAAVRTREDERLRATRRQLERQTRERRRIVKLTRELGKLQIHAVNKLTEFCRAQLEEYGYRLVRGDERAAVNE